MPSRPKKHRDMECAFFSVKTSCCTFHDIDCLNTDHGFIKFEHSAKMQYLHLNDVWSRSHKKQISNDIYKTMKFAYK